MTAAVLLAEVLARVEEVRQVALAATPGPWRVCAEGSEGSRIAPANGDKREQSRFLGILNGRVQPEDGRNAALIVDQADPAAVLRRCDAVERAARRAAEQAERHEAFGPQSSYSCRACGDTWPCRDYAAALDTLRDLGAAL